MNNHLTLQLVYQAILLIMQAINQIYDILPPKGKTVAFSVLLLLQASRAIRNLWVNPNGTPATLPYDPSGDTKTGFKLPSILIFLLLLPAAARAQDQGFMVGFAFNNNGSPQILGSGSYDKEIFTNTYSISGYDITPIKQEGTLIPKLKFTPYTGFLYRVASLGKIDVFAKGAGGLATTGTNTTGAGIIGGLIRYPFGKGWSINAGGEGSYSPINGTDAILRVGFRYGGK